jgi:hypothetical protein
MAQRRLRWIGLRRRTKVLLVVVTLITAVALLMGHLYLVWRTSRWRRRSGRLTSQSTIERFPPSERCGASADRKADEINRNMHCGDGHERLASLARVHSPNGPE